MKSSTIKEMIENSVLLYPNNIAFYEKENKEYKGITRGIYKRKDVIFNQDLYDNATLIEVGGVDNTIEEVNNTLEAFAKVLSEYIKEHKEV